MNGMDDFTKGEIVNSLKNIGKQLEISNRLAILDRLVSIDTITKESYVEELKELLTK